jgi:hypothetical protein
MASVEYRRGSREDLLALGRVWRAGLTLRAAGEECIRLEVRPDSQAALRLYARFGFRKVGAFRDSRGRWEVMTLQVREPRADHA